MNNIIKKIMENKKQSSIDWLESELKYLLEKYRNFEVSEDEFVAIQNQLFNDAKKKHKIETVIAYSSGFISFFLLKAKENIFTEENIITAEQYYNLTFKPQNNDN